MDLRDAVTDPSQRAKLADLQERIKTQLRSVDAHQRLVGRPLSYNVIAGQAVEIVFREVPSIDESDVLAVKRLIGETCFCTVTPETAETLTVRFVVRLKDASTQRPVG